MTKKEEIQKELIEKIYKKMINAMMSPNGEMFRGGSEDFLNGLITAYRIVESYDPKPAPKADEMFKELDKSKQDKTQKSKT